MKKSLRIFVALALVAVLALGCFAGCEAKTFEQKYGITISDKTVTYDGNAYGVEIDVNTEVLKDREYTVEYKYSKDGQELEGTSFKDAGVYDVVASVLVAGEDTPTELKAKLTINKANVEVELGNFFLRQGQGLSSIGKASLSDDTVKLQGTDKVKDLGKVSYEVYNGTEKVTDLSALKPTAKETDALTVVMAFENEPTNYNFTFKNGKLYVLSSADYSVAERLKKEIANVPTSETINTFTYDQMQSFVDTADDIVSTYPGTSAIQRLMSGTVNVESISGLLKTAKERLSMTYSVDFDLDSSVGKGYIIAIEHTANNSRSKDDDDFLSELMGTKNSSLTDVEYKDIICFAIYIKDSTQYKLNSVTVRGKSFTPTTWYNASKYNEETNDTVALLKAKTGKTTLSGNEMIYLFGNPRTKESVLNNSSSLDDKYKDNKDNNDKDDQGKPINYKHWYGSKNYGALSGSVINASVLGALDGSNSITIIPNYVNQYKISVGGEESNTFVEKITDTTNTFAEVLPNVQKVTISSKGTNYFNAGTQSVSTYIYHGLIPNGSVAKITIQPKTGYVISEVEIGDTTVSADKFTSNGYEYSYEFTVTEDMVNTKGELNIYIKLVDSYSLKVKINNLEVKNSSKNGVYTDKNKTGTIKLTGDAIVTTDVPTLLGEKSLTIEVTPSTNYVLESLVLKGKKYNPESTNTDKLDDKTYNLLTDPQFSYVNGKISIDLSAETEELLCTKDVTIEATFKEVYPIKVTSSRNGEALETATKAGNSYTTKYGKVTVYDVEDEETNNLYKGQQYYIEIESATGYVPSKITIGGTVFNLLTQDDSTVEYKRYQVTQGSDMYVLSKNENSSSYITENGLDKLKRDDTETGKTRYYLICSPSKVAAGENFVIDIEFDAYYYLDLDVSYANGTGNEAILEATLLIKGVVTSSGLTNDENTITNQDPIGGVKFSYLESSVIYKAEGTLYAYFNDTSKNKIGLKIDPKNNYTLEDPTWQYGKSSKETKSKMSVDKTYFEALDDTMLGGTTPEKATIKPGDSITVSFDCDPVRKNTSEN